MPIPVHDFPSAILLCGEKVPLERQDVWEMMDQAFVLSVYNQEQVILWIKRANRYFPHIEKRLRERNLPDDLKYVAVVESSLRTYAVSSAKATGPWQFMEKTAKRYGLRVDSAIDERLNFEKATESALNYLADLHRQFGNWGLAMAAYNCGEDRVAKSLEMQQAAGYYDLDLPQETERYIFRILSAKVILANEVTRLCRGEEAARTAEATAAATFAGGGLGQDLPVLELPAAGLAMIDALVGIGFAASRGEAKRLIAGGGARIDGEAVTDESFHIAGGAERRISSGKKKHGILRPA